MTHAFIDTYKNIYGKLRLVQFMAMCAYKSPKSDVHTCNQCMSCTAFYNSLFAGDLVWNSPPTGAWVWSSVSGHDQPV